MSTRYEKLKKRISESVSVHEARDYESIVNNSLNQNLITENEANELYDLIDAIAMHFEDLYITTPNKIEDSEEDLKSKIKKVFEKKNDSKIFLFENDGDFVESFDDGDIDFSKLETYEDRGNLVASFMITGGLNGSGEWKNYLSDLEKLLKELESETGYKATIYQINTDVADDVWNGMIFLHKKPDVKDSLFIKIGDIINKTKEGYVIYSEKGKRLSKPYKTRKEAEERLKEIEMFKHMKKDALEHPELYGKKIKITVNNALSNVVDRLFSQSDVISREVKNKNEIEYVLSYDGRVEYFLRRFKKKYVILDSYYKGYGIEKKNDNLYQVWKYRLSENEDEKVAGDFVSEEEAKEWIDKQGESIPKVKKEENHHYDVYYVDYATDRTMVEKDVLAESEADAKRKVKRMYGKQIYGYPHDAVLIDSKKEIKDNMIEEVKKWLEKYLVKENDPANKLGKTHIRPLKENERLPRGVYHKAATDKSGILHYKGGNYYWYIDNNDEIHVERHISDSVDDRFVCESFFDEKGHGLEDRMETNDINKAKDWVLDKAQDGYATRIIDKLTGEVWPFKTIEDPFELDTVRPYEEEQEEEEDIEIISPEEYMVWVVEWYDKKGYKFTGEFDSKEDAEEFLKEHQDEDHIQIQIKEQNRFVEDSKKFDKEKVEKQLRKILTDYLLKEGFPQEDIDEWLVIRMRNFKNDYGDEGIEIEIANEFVDYWDLPEEVTNALDKVVDPSYFEPYSSTIWQAYIWDQKLED